MTLRQLATCPQCEGTGENNHGKRCQACAGDGWVRTEEQEEERKRA